MDSFGEIFAEKIREEMIRENNNSFDTKDSMKTLAMLEKIVRNTLAEMKDEPPEKEYPLENTEVGEGFE